MGWPVVLTPQAQRDLEGIVAFIRQDSPFRAISFGDALVDTALSLGQFPEMGRIVPELEDPEVREITHGSYRIIYEYLPGSGTLYILRFWHAARGRPRLENG